MNDGLDKFLPAKQPEPKQGSLFLTLVGGVTVIGAVFYAFSGVGAMFSGPSCSQSSAEFHSRALVRSELQTPSTASFGSRQITRGTDCTFNIRGTVDAQNGFGATVRHQYSVTVKRDSVFRADCHAFLALLR